MPLTPNPGMEYNTPMENQDALPATKGDLRQLEERLEERFEGRFEGLSAMGQRFAIELVKTNARIDKLGDSLRAEIREGNSKILKTVEEFAVQTKMVDRHQIITDYRVAELEKRVKGLETPH